MRNALLFVCGLFLATSCSLLLDTSAAQCVTDNDCSAFASGTTRSVCGPRNVCMKGPECLTNTECLNVPGALPSTCRKSDHKCVVLGTKDCVYQAEAGDLSDDNTLWFGILSQRTSAPHMEAAVDLVRQEIVRASNLPPATVNGPRRPLAFVSCNTEGQALVASLNHLINDVQVPAIIGANVSGDVVMQLQNFTTNAGILSISPTAAAPNLSDIDTKGLFFRASASDLIGVKSLAYILETVVEPQLRGGATPVLAANEPLNVAVLYRDDALGNSDSGALSTFGVFNGKPARDNGSHYQTISYGDGSGANMGAARKAMAVSQLIAFRPHVIFVFGGPEFGPMDKDVETRWPADAKYRPTWLVVKGIGSVFTDSIGTNADWARRVYGTQPFVDKTTSAYAAFEASFKSKFPPMVAQQVGATATPSFYDSAYVLAYAVTANRGNPVTGANLASAIRNQLTPVPMGVMLPKARELSVGFDNAFTALTALSAGERIDLQGLTGKLDFLPNGDVNQTQEIFCMRTEPDAQGGFGKVVGTKSSGMYFDPLRAQVIGSVMGCPGP
jgi:hypothetical protein